MKHGKPYSADGTVQAVKKLKLKSYTAKNFDHYPIDGTELLPFGSFSICRLRK